MLNVYFTKSIRIYIKVMIKQVYNELNIFFSFLVLNIYLVILVKSELE